MLVIEKIWKQLYHEAVDAEYEDINGEEFNFSDTIDRLIDSVLGEHAVEDLVYDMSRPSMTYSTATLELLLTEAPVDIDWNKVPMNTPLNCWHTDTENKIRKYYVGRSVDNRWIVSGVPQGSPGYITVLDIFEHVEFPEDVDVTPYIKEEA